MVRQVNSAGYAENVSEASWDRSRCSVAGTLSVVGEKWSLLLLREAFFGVRRFADFQRVLGAPKAVLTDRLATLVEQGILKRVPYQAEGERQRHEYRLTTKGIDLYPTLVALMAWGDRYLADDVAPLELRHRDCGEPVHLALVCDAGHELGGARDVRPVPRTTAATR
jgi:DNA-binding HxlR family transcriptional regulator